MVSYAITGASRGLGLEFIRQISQKKDDVVFAIVRNTNSSPELMELAKNSNVHIVRGDLNSFSSLQEAAKTVSSINGGKLDVLINNAAFLDSSTVMVAPTQLTDPENLDRVKDMIEKSIESNVWGTIYVTNSFLPLVEAGSEKKIVHISTGMADTDIILGTEIVGLVPYSVSKSAMNTVVAKYGAELKRKGIHVVAMSPGWVDTNPVPPEAVQWMADMFRNYDPDVRDRIKPVESVRCQLDSISKLDWSVQGRMISHHGNNKWF